MPETLPRLPVADSGAWPAPLAHRPALACAAPPLASWGSSVARGVPRSPERPHWWLQKQADARRRVEELTSAIEADSGALGENTRQKLVNQLETDGVLQAARTLGISVSDVTAAILDDTDALARVNEALARTGEIMTSQGDQAFRQYEGEINTVTGAVEGQTAAITEAKAAIERKRDALVGITPKVDAFGNTIQSAGDKTGGAASKIETNSTASRATPSTPAKPPGATSKPSTTWPTHSRKPTRATSRPPTG